MNEKAKAKRNNDVEKCIFHYIYYKIVDEKTKIG